MRFSAITSAAVATQVWAAATRNLTNPSGVFSDATRTLTSIASNYAGIFVLNTAFATNAILDLRPAAGKFTDVVLATSGVGAAVAGVTGAFGTYDGTTFTAVSANNYSTAQYVCKGANAGILTIKNTSAGSQTIGYSGFTIS